MQPPTRRLLTSSGLSYVSDGPAGEHSPFARQFIEALRTYGGADSFLNIAELWVSGDLIKLKPAVKDGTFKGDGAGSDFFFVRRPQLKPIDCPEECKCVP